MLGKSLIAAAILTVAAAGTATTASAHPGGYKRVVTVQQCIGGSKYLVRKVSFNGRVLSRTRIGRCYTAKKHWHHVKTKRVVKRIYRKAFNN